MAYKIILPMRSRLTLAKVDIIITLVVLNVQRENLVEMVLAADAWRADNIHRMRVPPLAVLVPLANMGVLIESLVF